MKPRTYVRTTAAAACSDACSDACSTCMHSSLHNCQAMFSSAQCDDYIGIISFIRPSVRVPAAWAWFSLPSDNVQHHIWYIYIPREKYSNTVNHKLASNAIVVVPSCSQARAAVDVALLMCCVVNEMLWMKCFVNDRASYYLTQNRRKLCSP